MADTVKDEVFEITEKNYRRELENVEKVKVEIILFLFRLLMTSLTLPHTGRIQRGNNRRSGFSFPRILRQRLR